MKTNTWAIALCILCCNNAQAQDTKGSRSKQTSTHGCMMMSDSTSAILGLTAVQIIEVKESDARCMKACEQNGDGAMGKMDDAAMTVHAADMKRILTAEQYAKWSVMCNTSRAEHKPDATPKN